MRSIPETFTTLHNTEGRVRGERMCQTIFSCTFASATRPAALLTIIERTALYVYLITIDCKCYRNVYVRTYVCIYAAALIDHSTYLPYDNALMI